MIGVGWVDPQCNPESTETYNAYESILFFALKGVGNIPDGFLQRSCRVHKNTLKTIF